MAVKILTLTVTWKTKPDANPYKQIPGSMQEKRFKAKKKKKILVSDSSVALRLKQFSNGKIMAFDEMFYILYTPHKFQKTRK